MYSSGLQQCVKNSKEPLQNSTKLCRILNRHATSSTKWTGKKGNGGTFLVPVAAVAVRDLIQGQSLFVFFFAGFSKLNEKRNRLVMLWVIVCFLLAATGVMGYYIRIN